MTARLAAEIAEHIEEATNANRNGSRDTSHFEMRLAVVKATLYAAEQQRIANLIAFAAHHLNIYTDAGDERAEITPKVHEQIRTVATQVLEGLDLS